MRTLSLFGRNHPWATRLLIILVFYPLLNAIAWILGIILYSEGIHLSYSLLYLISILAFIMVSRSQLKNISYLRRNVYHAVMILLTISLVSISGNNYLQRWSPERNFHSVNASEIKPEKKAGKKTFKKFVKNLATKYQKSEKSTKVILIILTILIALLLTIGLAALCCSIACSGAEALAFLVGLLGLGGIIFGVVKVLQSIKRKYGKKQPKERTS